MSVHLTSHNHIPNGLLIPSKINQLAPELEKAQSIQWVRRAHRHRNKQGVPVEDLDNFSSGSQHTDDLEDLEKLDLKPNGLAQLLPGPALQYLGFMPSYESFGLGKKLRYPKAFGFNLSPKKQAETLLKCFSLMIEPVM